MWNKLGKKDAASTIILSTTWKQLWRKYLKSLKKIDFYIADLDIYDTSSQTCFCEMCSPDFPSTLWYHRVVTTLIIGLNGLRRRKLKRLNSTYQQILKRIVMYWKLYNFPKRLFTGEGEEYYSTLRPLSLTHSILKPSFGF